MTLSADLALLGKVLIDLSRRRAEFRVTIDGPSAASRNGGRSVIDQSELKTLLRRLAACVDAPLRPASRAAKGRARSSAARSSRSTRRRAVQKRGRPYKKPGRA